MSSIPAARAGPRRRRRILREYTGLLGDAAACRLSVNDEGVEIQIDRHGRSAELQQPPRSITLDVGGGETASLTGLVPILQTVRPDHQRMTLKASRLVVGPTAFHGTEQITGIRFVPTNERHAIYWTAHLTSGGLDKDSEPIQALDPVGAFLGRYQVDVIDSEMLEAAQVVSGHVSVRLDVSHTTQANRQGVQRNEQRCVSIGYAMGRTLDEAVGDVEYVCAFMSLMLGKVIAPTRVSFGTPAAGITGMRTFELHSQFRTPSPEMAISDLNTGLISANEDRDPYKAALGSWLARREAWQQATTLAIDALELTERLDRQRFLNATSWFEAIPNRYLEPSAAASPRVLDGAAEAATKVLAAEGHEGLGARIRGLLGSINAPSLAMRLEAAVGFLRWRYGEGILPADADAVCRLIPGMRGRYAHGDDPLLGHHAGSVYAATILLETICYLLMICDLGFDLVLRLGADHLLTDRLLKLPHLTSVGAQC